MAYAVQKHVMVIIYTYSDTMHKKKCKLCGNIFLTKYHQTKYCSEECKKRAVQKQKSEWNRRNPQYYNKMSNIFTKDFIEEVRNNTYDFNLLPEYWQKREKEAPGYLLSIAELYNDCNFTCEISGRSGSAVHHLNAYHWDIEGRCNKNNMIVINDSIHKFFHFLYGTRNNNIEQFNEFLNIHFCTSIDTILNNRGVRFCN